MLCSLRAMWYGSTSAYWRRAWPMPATLPWPKMPKQPANSRCSRPSRSLYWLARNSTRAWAMVSRRVPLIVLPPGPVMGRRGSSSWPSQVPRTQAWAGSSQKRQARSGAGPAITLR